MAAQKSSVSPDQAKIERAIAAELALKAGDYRNPLVTQYLNEMGQKIELERRRLAQELWELRNEWPHRLELRAEASRRAQIALAAEGAMKKGDYTSPQVAQHLNEMRQEIQQEWHRLQRLEVHAYAARVSSELFSQLGVKTTTPCPHTKSV